MRWYRESHVLGSTAVMSDEALLSGKGYPIGGKHRKGPLKHSIQDRVLLPALPYQEQNISHAV